jgi:CheY-like chemotaxis protein
MSSQHARSKLAIARLASNGGSALERSSGGSLAEVVTTEQTVKRALSSLVRQALSKEVILACEILPGVGRYVLGSRRQLGDLVAHAAGEGVAACEEGEVCVRIARQRAGLAPTDVVLVSVSILHGQAVRDLECLEASLPLADGEDVQDAIVLADRRVLIVVPTAHGARVQTTAARRFGASVESALESAAATALLRAAHSEGKPFDVVFVDEATQGAEELLGAARDDASLGGPSRIVATALEDAAKWEVFGAESILSKPVLPLELCDALRDSGRHEVELTLEQSAAAITHVPPGQPRRRASGIRRLDLAAVLAAVAVAPRRGKR